MKMLRALILSLATFALGYSTAAQAAGDEGLYDPAPPPNSAFVRVIDARGQGNLQVTVGEAAIAVPATGISPYVVIPAGEQDVSLSTESKKLSLAAGKYYTIALFVGGSTEPTLLEDEILSNPAKSGIYVYNFSDAPSVKLFAPKPNAVVVDNLKPGSSAFKSVNAVTIDLALMDGPTKVADFNQLALKRRTGLTFVVFGSGAAKKGVAVPNQTVR
jgi:alginate O-acetyltransferase complex protein AlgF